MTSMTRNRSGVMLDIRPYRAWVRTLLRRARESGAVNPRQAVCAQLGIGDRTLTRWLTEFDLIDESVVDDAASKIGSIMGWEIYEMDFRPEDGDREEPPIPEKCASKGCAAPHNGGRFCHEHGEQLARIRAAYKEDGAIMHSNGGADRKRANKAKKAGVPICCNPNCWNEREHGVRFCGGCIEEGWDENVFE